MEDVVTAPCQSLITQSHRALEAKSPTNGDGFGLAWYGERPEPGLYRDILPAWSDPNLRSLCRQIRSHVFFAHVRAATLGATSRANCHPFVVGRWTFMHNGQIGGFERMRRRLERGLSDTTYDARQGTTDSELFFLLMLDENLEADPFTAAQAGVARVLAAAEDAGIEPHIRLTAAFTDGDCVHAVRYATDAFAPTLYTGQFCGTAGRCLVSEPLDRQGAAWQAVPPGSFVTMTRQAVTIRPFMVGKSPVAALA